MSERPLVARPEAKSGTPAPPKREPRPPQNQKLTVSGPEPLQKRMWSLQGCLSTSLLPCCSYTSPSLQAPSPSAVGCRQQRPGNGPALQSGRVSSRHGCGSRAAARPPDRQSSTVSCLPSRLILADKEVAHPDMTTLVPGLRGICRETETAQMLS